jgi:hypothetical protein
MHCISDEFRRFWDFIITSFLSTYLIPISYLGKYCYNSAYWLDAVSVRGRGGEAWLQACTNNRKGIIIYGDVADVP